MKTGKIMTAPCLAFLLVLSAGRTAVAASETALLVVPSRIRVLQLGFDIASGRPVRLVTYQGAPRSAIFHVWSGSDWMRISKDSLRDFSFMGETPRHTVLIGDDSMVPDSLENILSGHKGFVRIPSVDAAEIINSLKEPLRMSPGDLLWFAERYELDMVDLNAPKRINTRSIPRSKIPGQRPRPQDLPEPEKLSPVPVEVKPF